eukprot:2226901-Rhodomonas_salina.1
MAGPTPPGSATPAGARLGRLRASKSVLVLAGCALFCALLALTLSPRGSVRITPTYSKRAELLSKAFMTHGLPRPVLRQATDRRMGRMTQLVSWGCSLDSQNHDG